MRGSMTGRRTAIACSAARFPSRQPSFQPIVIARRTHPLKELLVMAKAKRKPSAAFMKPMQPNAQLAQVIGDKPLPRTEVTKKLWAYIKKNGLQDSKNRRNINADAALLPIFGKKQVSMFEMTKLVSKCLK